MRLLWFGACPARGRLRESPVRVPFGKVRGIAAVLGSLCDNYLFLQKVRASPSSPDRRPGVRIQFASRTPSLGSRPSLALWPSRTTKRDRLVWIREDLVQALNSGFHHMLDVSAEVVPRLFALGESGGLRHLFFTFAPSLRPRPRLSASAPSRAHPLCAVAALSVKSVSDRPRRVQHRDSAVVWLVLGLKQYIAPPEPCSYILLLNRC